MNDTKKFTYEEWLDAVAPDNNLELLRASGARVTEVQVRAMMTERGDMVTPGGTVYVKGNLRDSLDQFDYFTTCRAGRMSLGANVAVVPQSGYLTRQLVSILHDITVTAPTPDLVKYDESLNIVHRYGPIRPCDLPRDLSTMNPHPIGAKVGIITAQSISERLTQTSLSSKHTAGSTIGAGAKMLSEDNSPIKRFKQVLGDVESWRRNDDGDMVSLWESYEMFKEKVLDILDIEEVHLAVLFRGMTEVLKDGTLRSDPDNVGRELEVDPIECGLTTLPLKYDSLLKGLRYGYVVRVLTEALLSGSTREMLDSERVICGMLPSTLQTERGL